MPYPIHRPNADQITRRRMRIKALLDQGVSKEAIRIRLGISVNQLKDDIRAIGGTGRPVGVRFEDFLEDL